MTQNLNLGALNNCLFDVMNYTASKEVTKVFFIRNLTKSNIYLYNQSDWKKNWSWLTAHPTVQAKVLKPPQPVILPRTTTSTIINFSSIAIQMPLNDLTVLVLHATSKMKFMVANGVCEIEFMPRGHRGINFNDVRVETQNNINRATMCNLASNVNIRTIWGTIVCIIDFFDFFDDTSANIDINL